MILIEENDERFYLKKSTQPNAGLGVFASKDLKKGDFIEIIGVMVKKNSIADVCTSYANNYKFAAAYDNEYDMHIVPMGFGGMVNHANNKEEQNAEIKYIEHKIINSAAGKAVYYFIKDIKKDEEILGNYGENWNNAIQWIQKIPKLIEDLEEKEWNRFLNFGLYNLDKLKAL
jgi:hypothetical protein